MSGTTLTYSCRDQSRDIGSVLTPSADLTTNIQSSSWQGVLPSAGFWQINAKSGDLQFCLALQAQSDLYVRSMDASSSTGRLPSRSETVPTTAIMHDLGVHRRTPL
jgi:hypothetical protein